MNDKEKALLYALLNSDLISAEILLAGDPSIINAVNGMNTNMIHLMVAQNASDSTIKFMMNHGANPRHKNGANMTAYGIAQKEAKRPGGNRRYLEIMDQYENQSESQGLIA